MNDQTQEPNTYTSEFKESTVKLGLNPISRLLKQRGIWVSTRIQFIPGLANIQHRKRLSQERMNILMMKSNA